MSSLEELYQLLNNDGIDIDTIELAESLWLSQYISKTAVVSAIDNDTTGTLDNTPIQQDDNLASIENKSPINTSKIKQANQQIRKDVPLHPTSDEISKDSLPFRIPLIRKLYKDNDLIYAFRHFRQKILSLEKSKLDEEKTADYMAKTDIFRPFYKKVYEKRFSILFIVDNSSSMKIWESLIEQFIKDINNYHIFKKVTVNYIFTDNDSPELFKKKEKISKLNNKWYQHTKPNTLIFMFSDMMSKSWGSGKLLNDITLWQQYLHFAIVQMLPQRLWTDTKLIDASIGKMSNHKKFAHNTQLVSRAEKILSIEEDVLPKLVKIPLLTFNENSIDAYGRVINALANNRIEGALFEQEDFLGEYQFLKSNNSIGAEERLRSFYKYASTTSKELLELLAIVPLSMPIIKLIQQELLPNSSQEHLSEVFMSSIIEKEQKTDGFYQFYRIENEKTGVREELIKKIGAKKAFQTIVKISKVLQRQSGVFDFLAYIVDPTTLKQSDDFSEINREFARISITVLNEMGEQYKDLADRLQDGHVYKENGNSDKLDIPSYKREQLTKNNSNKFTFTWKDIFREEVEKPYFKKLQKFLNDEEKDGKTILPKKEDWYKSLDSTKFSSVKVVILGASPYHGIGQADGLAYSVLPNTKIPPSLSNIFKELKDDLNIDYNDVGNLQYWAEQGVLLLNSVLTVKENKANSHTNKGWEIFTSKILEAINNERENIVFILWGTPSQKLGKNIDLNKHLIIKSPHPSPLSAYRGFFSSKPFSRTNDYLQAHNIKPIDWSLPKTQKQLIQDDENIIEKIIGKVTFECEMCSTFSKIYCSELDWEVINSSDRSMGKELEYTAEYINNCSNCNNSISIIFSSWEYPLGIENMSDVKLDGVKNIKSNCSPNNLNKENGVIKVIKEGFGFISHDKLSDDIFFHANNLSGVEFSDLQVDDELSFSLGRRRNGKIQAISVTVKNTNEVKNTVIKNLKNSGWDENNIFIDNKSHVDIILKDNNKIIAVIELKIQKDRLKEALTKAMDYAKKLNISFAFATNGKEIYEYNLITSQENIINSFPSLSSLQSRTIDNSQLISHEGIDKQHTRYKILWVDDRPDNNIYERAMFKKEDITFDLAPSTNEALEYIKDNQYLAIISDMGRKEGSQEGYVLLDKIRKINKNIPLFFYAGSNLEEHKEMALERGAQGSTNNSDELYKMIMSLIQKNEDSIIEEDDRTKSVVSDITFDCEECKIGHSLNCKELHWEQIGGSERNMGSELEYEAEYYETCHECNNDMSITFSCWEYPVGVENYRDTSSNGITNLQGDCCLELHISDEEYTEDYDEFMIGKDTSYFTLEEKKEELEIFLNNLIPFSELEYRYNPKSLIYKDVEIHSNNFLISREFDDMYLHDLIDEIREDIDELKLAIIESTEPDNILLIKKQYKIESNNVSEAYGVDIYCEVYSEDREQILYIYPSNKIKLNEDLFELEEEEHLDIDKAEVEPEIEKWFFKNYDDPANFLPYETREGGFQYLYGGPYELDEIMYDEFGGKYPDEYIQEVIKNIEHEHGDVAWGKRPSETDEYIEDSYIEKEYVASKIIAADEQKDISGLLQTLLPKEIDTVNIINEQIDGDFEGWNGESLVKLTNGEVWKQSEYYYEYIYAFMPNVTITHSLTGYKMKVDGVNKEVGVEELKNVIESKIHGSFNGWDGNTIVELINGEKWKQSTYNYSYSHAYSPDVIIYQSDYGFKMKVDGNDETVDVKRVI